MSEHRESTRLSLTFNEQVMTYEAVCQQCKSKVLVHTGVLLNFSDEDTNNLVEKIEEVHNMALEERDIVCSDPFYIVKDPYGMLYMPIDRQN